jgi:two-component system, NarL family, response regulator NreC
MMDDDVITVLLADDHAVVRYGLKAVLQTAPDITVIGEARNGREAVDATGRLKPDVVVMDLSMDVMDGAAATKELQRLGTTAKILILTMHAEDEHLVRLLDAGASGYLVKNAADRELVDAVRMVARGDQYLQLGAVRALAKELKKRDHRAVEQSEYESLSERERSILRFIAAGYTGPDIGAHLHISAKTVDTYKQRIHEKIGLVHRSDYVRFAVKLGLLDDDVRLSCDA